MRSRICPIASNVRAHVRRNSRALGAVITRSRLWDPDGCFTAPDLLGANGLIGWRSISTSSAVRREHNLRAMYVHRVIDTPKSSDYWDTEHESWVHTQYVHNMWFSRVACFNRFQMFVGILHLRSLIVSFIPNCFSEPKKRRRRRWASLHNSAGGQEAFFSGLNHWSDLNQEHVRSRMFRLKNIPSLGQWNQTMLEVMSESMKENLKKTIYKYPYEQLNISNENFYVGTNSKLISIWFNSETKILKHNSFLSNLTCNLTD